MSRHLLTAVLLVGVMFTPTPRATSTPNNSLAVRGVAGDLWADRILGQPDFTDIAPNGVGSKGLFNPYAVVVDTLHDRLYVNDDANNRVLGVSSLSSLTSGKGADVVLGQSNFSHSACNGDSNWQSYPAPVLPDAFHLCGMRYDGISPDEGGSVGNMAVDGQGNLYVPDYFNNRVMRYDWPISSNQAASHVWGQPDFTGYQYNNIGANVAGAPSRTSLAFYYDGSIADNHYYAGVGTDAWGNLWVADAVNNRVLRFPNPNVPNVGVPQSSADVVLGQSDFTSNAAASGATDLAHLRHPGAVRVDKAGNVYVSDIPAASGRIVVFKSTGHATSGQPQYGPNNTGLTAAGAITQYIDQIDGLEWDPAGDLWMAQYNQAVLFHFNLTSGVAATARKVLLQSFPLNPGQTPGATHGDGPDFVDAAGEQPSSWALAQDLRGSVGVDAQGNVYAAGGMWQDVLRFPNTATKPIPVLGSSDSGVAHSADLQIFKPGQWRVMNNMGKSDMYIASGLAVTGGQIIEANVNRLAFWNIPSGPASLANNQAASGFAGTTTPYLWTGNPFVRIREDHAATPHLWASHYSGDITLVEPYLLPLHDGDMPIAGKTLAPPLPVLGGGSVSWLAIEGLAVDPSGQYVWLSDKQNSRVLRVRNPLGASGGPIVDIILGQPDAIAHGCNVLGTLSNGVCSSSVLNGSTLYSPGALRLDHHGNLYVSDHALEMQGNMRMLRFDASTIQNTSSSPLFGVAATAAYGTGGLQNFTTAGCAVSDGICAPWEPGFNSDDSVMVLPTNGWGGGKFAFVVPRPVTNDTPSTNLKDFGAQSFTATFDEQDNLYVSEINRNRVLVYLKPFAAATPTVTPTQPTPTNTPTPRLTGTFTPTATFTPTPTEPKITRTPTLTATATRARPTATSPRPRLTPTATATGPCTGVPAWTDCCGCQYTTGQKVTFNGSLYHAAQTFTNTCTAGWNPGAVPSLWTRNGAC